MTEKDTSRINTLKSALVALLVGVLAVACSETEVNQTRTVLFYVSNQSSQDLVVDWGLKATPYYNGPLSIPAGATIRIHSYQRFKAPPPDANQEFICISMYRASDERLVHQLAPVTDEQWSQRWVTDTIVEYTLVLTAASLDTTLQNICATLTGVAIYSVTSTPLDQLRVTIEEDDGGGYQTSTAFGDTLYIFMWPGALPAADIRFERSRFVTRSFRLPDDATDLGDRHYQLNAVLAPPPIEIRTELATSFEGGGTDVYVGEGLALELLLFNEGERNATLEFPDTCRIAFEILRSDEVVVEYPNACGGDPGELTLRKVDIHRMAFRISTVDDIPEASWYLDQPTLPPGTYTLRAGLTIPPQVVPWAQMEFTVLDPAPRQRRGGATP